MSEYAFLTCWKIRAPIEQVWQLIHDSEDWPGWWRGVEKVVCLERGDAEGIGAVLRYTWKSSLPYRLAFNMRATRIEAPFVLEGEAFGELQGHGRWTLAQEGEWTSVRYEWKVRTTLLWMNVMAPLLKPIFRWNHDVVMHWGCEGLAKRLGCAFETTEP